MWGAEPLLAQSRGSKIQEITCQQRPAKNSELIFGVVPFAVVVPFARMIAKSQRKSDIGAPELFLGKKMQPTPSSLYSRILNIVL